MPRLARTLRTGDGLAVVVGIMVGSGIFRTPGTVAALLGRPGLTFVARALGGAVGVAMLAFRFVLKRKQPIFDGEFHLPRATKVDRRLLVGSGVFGVGWGTGGYCPGPGIAALSAASVEALVFVAGLAFGSFLYQRFAAPRG